MRQLNDGDMDLPPAGRIALLPFLRRVLYITPAVPPPILRDTRCFGRLNSSSCWSSHRPASLALTGAP